MNGCESCGARFLFYERVAFPQRWCRRCALERGVTRIADRLAISNVTRQAAKLEPWWRWTVWLYWGIAWDRGQTKRQAIERVNDDLANGRLMLTRRIE